ncbi:unnamed protein product [Camellia sinensis]
MDLGIMKSGRTGSPKLASFDPVQILSGINPNPEPSGSSDRTLRTTHTEKSKSVKSLCNSLRQIYGFNQY